MYLIPNRMVADFPVRPIFRLLCPVNALKLNTDMASVIKLPKDLADELHRLAEAEHKPRAAFVVELLRHDVRRAKQREALRVSAGAWKAANHPELAKGGAAHVEKIRSEPDRRFGGAIRRQRA